ncbi:MAG: FtsW/RodA/SpoVE family cell cycle protein [Patescibacteria group bacterium]
MRIARADTLLIIILAALVLSGALMFSSAAVGLLARGATNISSVVFNHFALGIGGGLAALLAGFSIDYRVWRTLAPYLFAFALLATALVFIPGLGFEHGGGRRWLDLGFTTAQPAELLKIAAVILAAALFATLREEMASWKGLAAFCGLCAAPALLLALQPDFGTLGIIVVSVFAVAIAAGVRLRDIALISVVAIASLVLLSFTPKYAYLYDRIATFINPAAQSAQGEGYQIRQSLIAIGSGGLAGRGLGQGIQKFTYLPEPMGDSIFAVVAEELGFIGASVTVVLFLVLGLRGYGLAARAPDLFGGLLAVGISTYLVGEAFINIAAMLGLAPLTGIPLTFISQGGSAMLVSLGSAGILLSISRRIPRK